MDRARERVGEPGCHGRAGTNTLTDLASRAVAIEQSHADGIYLGQYCITTLTWFFLTWFRIYLSQSRCPSIVTVGFPSAVPALCGFAGGILGGVASDRLLKAGHSLTSAQGADRGQHAPCHDDDCLLLRNSCLAVML